MVTRRKPRSTRSARPPARRTEKLQRWLDLLAALLVRQTPAPFETLAADVPAYREARASGGRRARPGAVASASSVSSVSSASVKRMFERDKDELRAFGVPIESVVSDDGATSLYRLRHADFYLPYLSLVSTAGSSQHTSQDHRSVWLSRAGAHRFRA